MTDINLGVGAANSASGGYEIANSCKFNKAGSETMYRANTNGDRRTWTSSFWMKFCGGTGSGTDTHMLYHGVYGQGTRMFTSGGTDQLYIDLCALGNERYRWITNQVFRDRSAWYHIVWRVDTTQSTLGDRMRLYVNGEQITDWQKEADDADADGSNSGNKMPQNYQTLANLDHSGYDVIQFSYKEASIYPDMYMAEFHHCDGYSYGPTEFGKFDSNGIWVPIEADVSYGNNGCYLDFETSSNLGNDANGGTDFTLQNIAAADQATDTPTNNFCTLNILDQEFDGTNIVTDGATNVRIAGSGSGCIRGTQAVSSGKWYWEFKLTPINTSTFYGVWGIYTAETSPPEGYPGRTGQTGSWGVYGGNGEAAGSSGFNTFYTDGFSSGDIIGLAYDVDGGTLKMYKNGTLVGANSGDIIASSGVSHPAGFNFFYQLLQMVLTHLNQVVY